MIKVWLYQIIRSKPFVYAAECSIVALAILYAGWHSYIAANAWFMGESLGLLIVLLSCQICFHLNGVEELFVYSKPQIFLQKTLKSIVAGLLVVAPLFFIFPRLSPGYATAAASACFLAFGLIVLRPVVRTLARRRTFVEGTLVVGSEDRAGKLYHELIQGEEPGGVRVIQYKDLPTLAKQDRFSRIVVADQTIDADSELAEALIDCKLRGMKIESAVDSFEKANRKIWIEGLSARWLIFTDGFNPSKVYLGLKRMFDAILAFVLLILTAPLMVLIAAVIKLDSAGPAIFRQERVGLHGRKFTLYKFRSMRHDAEDQTGPIWARESDNRITSAGRVLRKCRLDELPQLINVLCGEMSFVGPRPERPYFVELLNNEIRYFDLRHYVKPGITGWAQVMYPYGASVEDAYQKLQYDLYYAKHISASLDLLVLLKTIKVVLAGEGR